MSEEHKPYISPKTILPETTIKAFFLGAILSMVLAAANAYLGLFAGMTVSASIPAAVMSMAVLRLFKHHNILENNIVQTAASAGESVAAGVIFTFPALILMGTWAEFKYWETFLIAVSGGILGVLFTVPLRSALIVKQKLLFPEGVATAEVLKTGEKGGKAVRFLVIGAVLGAIVKLCASGMKLWQEIAEGAALIGGKAYTYFGMNLSPALIGVGYIVGIRIAILVFAGGCISWFFAIPIYIAANDLAVGDNGAVALGYDIWSRKVRYIGVGAMIIGGLWALVSLRGSIGFAVKSGIDAFKKKVDPSTILRTERDTPMNWVLTGVVIMLVPVFMIYLQEIHNIPITGLMAVFMVIVGFLFSAVAGYMAGLVGSSNNPISGVTIATVLTASLILLLILGGDAERGPAAAILIGAVVCCAAAIAGDNMQDLKAGYILGATPRRQQIMQVVGVVSAALILPFVLQLLLESNGFGPKTAENPDSLTAPQATLMASVAEGVFTRELPWLMINIGIAIGALIIALDKYLEAKKIDFRVPVLAVAVGIYLPFELDSAIMLGGVLAWLVSRYQGANQQKVTDFEKQSSKSNAGGLLFASGLITGEALMGIGIAFVIAATQDPEFMQFGSLGLGSIPGIIIVGIVCYWLYRVATSEFLSKDE